MNYFRIFCFLITCSFALAACSQSENDHRFSGKSIAEKRLKEALAENPNPVQVGVAQQLEDSTTAIEFAERKLFAVYGKENILKEKPYKCSLIDHYWVISGTLPEDYLGGTFLIILDAKDGTIIQLTHGK